MNKEKSRFLTRVSLIFSVGVLLLALGVAGHYLLPILPRLADIISSAQPAFIFFALALHLLACFLRACKMHIVLRPKHSLLQTYHVFNTGLLLNCLLPFRAGELGMVFLLSSKGSLTGGEALSKLFVDRLLDMLVVMAFTLAAFWSLAPPAAATEIPAAVLHVCAALGAIVGTVFLIIALEDQLMALTRKAVGHLLKKDPAAWESHFRAFVEGFRALFRAGTFFPAFGIALLSWVTIVLSYQAGMQALFPPPQIGCAIMATCMTVFGLVVAPVPSGTGTTHGAIVIALTMFGVDLAQAFAFALLYHALTTGANICLGFASARSLGLKPSTLLKRIRPHEDKP